MDRYFGTDGIRGRVGEEPLTPEFVLRLGAAAGCVLAKSAPHPLVVVGRDTRASGPMLSAALAAGMASAGVNVLDAGVITTPGVARLVPELKAAAGVVISASHNPAHDNGIKFFGPEGTKLPDEVEDAIEAALTGVHALGAGEVGDIRAYPEGVARYEAFCLAQARGVSLKGMKILVDGANGAASALAPELFRKLGAEVFEVGTSPDGLNINAGVGAAHTEHLVEAVRAAGADIGLSFDGDADRLIMADANGLFNGDAILYAMVKARIAEGRKPDGVVGTLMTNYALEAKLAQLGVAFERAKVGDRYVFERLKARGWVMGGETSGHLLALDVHSTGDGIVSALLVLCALSSHKTTMAEWTRELVLMPQVLINRRIEKGFDWAGCAPFAAAVKAAEEAVKGRGRVLVRPSGTEPLLRIMVEADSPALAQRVAEETAAALP